MIKMRFLLAAMALQLAATDSALAVDMKIGGTGAMRGVAQRLAAAFGKLRPGARVEVVPGLGSSGGIAGVGEGVLQLALSGRDLKAQEKAKGLAAAPFIDTPFLFVTSHAQHQRLSRADVMAIYGQAMVKWPDGKPIKPILRPKSDSVTSLIYDNFPGIESVMDKLRQRPDVLVAATDQDNIQAAERIPNSFTGATLAQFTTEAPRLRTITLDGVDASIDAVERGAYALKMRTYFVVKSEPSLAVQQFLQFVRSEQGVAILRASGAIPVAARAAMVQ